MTRSRLFGGNAGARAVALGAICAAVIVRATLWADDAHAYRSYDNGSGQGCVQCHSLFKGGPQYLLHAVHTNNFGISECNACHPNGPGSKPVATYWSGPGGGLGCAGCHGQDYGETSPNSGLPKATAYGLRQVHAAAGVVCTTCHQPGQLGHADPAPAPLGEDVAPPYYGTSISNLVDSCSSAQEDSSYDADAIGLDNDGDGAADWPADLDCPVPASTTTTTTTSTTTTTLPAGCAPAPVPGCVAPLKGVLLVNEKSAGKEKLKVGLKKLQPAVAQGDYGDPVAGTTSYAVCVYDDLGQLAGSISVARAGDLCGSPPASCWVYVQLKGYKYGDKDAAADGIAKMTLSGGGAGKGKVVIVGKNKAAAGQTSLPTGIAPALQGNGLATVQLVTSDAECFGATVTNVKKADGAVFKAVTP